MNGGYKRDADIYIAFRLQLLVKAIFITLMYGPGLPGCYLISFYSSSPPTGSTATTCCASSRRRRPPPIG